MTSEIDDLLQKYFDGEISEAQLQSLQLHLANEKDSRYCFVESAFLHDRLRGVFQAQSALRSFHPLPADDTEGPRAVASQTNRWLNVSRRRILTSAAIAAGILLVFALWRSGNDTALAGVAELKRMIAASSLQSVRAYSMAVESSEPESPKRRHVESDEKRPIKPSLDRAILYIRGKHEFVLMRKTPDGEDFITGSDGESSWAISPDGPVRTSRDLTRFHRDVPGHEFSMPLCNLNDALEQLQSFSDLALLPVEYGDSDQDGVQPRRLLVATKKRGQRGPRRVEITYFADSGLIEHVRFVDMPYGPDRITVRLSLMPTPLLPDGFFQHRAHHVPDRRIESE